jgi:hypothetical protein
MTVAASLARRFFLNRKKKRRVPAVRTQQARRIRGKMPLLRLLRQARTMLNYNAKITVEDSVTSNYAP